LICKKKKSLLFATQNRGKSENQMSSIVRKLKQVSKDVKRSCKRLTRFQQIYRLSQRHFLNINRFNNNKNKFNVTKSINNNLSHSCNALLPSLFYFNQRYFADITKGNLWCYIRCVDFIVRESNILQGEGILNPHVDIEKQAWDKRAEYCTLFHEMFDRNDRYNNENTKKLFWNLAWAG